MAMDTHTHTDLSMYMHVTYPLHQLNEAQRLLQWRQVEPKPGHHGGASDPQNRDPVLPKLWMVKSNREAKSAVGEMGELSSPVT